MSANSPDAPLQLDIVLVKAGRIKIRYPAELLHDDGTHVTVRAAWAGAGVRDFGFVRFEPGDVFTEHYWRDRWYAVKEVRGPEGVLKGWYCDITRPASVSEGELVVEDLDLDLWRSADGTGRTASGRGRVRGERSGDHRSAGSGRRPVRPGRTRTPRSRGRLRGTAGLGTAHSPVASAGAPQGTATTAYRSSSTSRPHSSGSSDSGSTRTSSARGASSPVSRLGGYADRAHRPPDALYEHESSARPEQSAPVPQDTAGIGQRPQHMADKDDVEALLPDRRGGRVPDQERGVPPGQLGAGEVDHARRGVDPGHPMPLLGREERQAARTAAEIEHVGRAARQPAAQPGRPGLAHGGIPQSVVGLVVERHGLGVPVDAGPLSTGLRFFACAVTRHVPRVTPATDNGPAPGRRGTTTPGATPYLRQNRTVPAPDLRCGRTARNPQLSGMWTHRRNVTTATDKRAPMSHSPRNGLPPYKRGTR